MSYATQLIPARPAPPLYKPPISGSRIIGLFGLGQTDVRGARRVAITAGRLPQRSLGREAR